VSNIRTLNTRNIVDYLIIITILVLSGSLYFTNFGGSLLLIPFTVLLISIGLLYKIKITSNLTLFLAGMVILGVINPNVNYGSWFALATRSINCLLIVMLIPFHRFSRIYIKIIVFIALLSWLSFIVILFNITSPLPDLHFIDDRYYRNFIFFVVPEGFIKANTLRNCGLWWEPGVFQIFLNVALVFGLHQHNLTWKQYAILLITMLTTFSTVGIVVFILISLVFYYRNKQTLYTLFLTVKNFRLRVNPIFFVGLLIFLVLIKSVSFKENVFGKLSNSSSKFESTAVRLFDNYIDAHIFIDHPLIGVGLGNFEIREIYAMKLKNTHPIFQKAHSLGTAGIVQLIGQMGGLVLLFIWPLFFPKYLNLNLIEKIIIALAIFLTFNSQSFSYFIFFMILISYGYYPNLNNS